ncbi:ATP-binding cassette domain-containing protein [Paenibacillus wynnii]|uniref:ATP-binding cassette domain-containing protein n=1 Tax=Paenibacillus wynnii TaxID=268407 RepID=UPI002790153D|nr:ATP-binding cassette domain-containing protein [Paenibacillus wynnii]MDQ0192342.1 energy-coupling factor transporter ATP-binding protein EcfA2/energy-coupling factor transporter transmembrane protein EcfT [Paenibacillus wynnii]
MTIKLEDITYSYDKKQVLHDINIQIPEGRLTLICGVTGSGKSTLLRLISRLDEPNSGSISSSIKDDKSAVSMVFQQPETQLFASSAHKDIEYGLEQREVSKPLRPQLIQYAMDKVGLPYELYSQRSPFLLSGGEKRRLCIAGAIAITPDLLVLDEPTAGLDPPAVRGFLQTIQELLRSGLTIVIGTHDLDSFFPIADKVVVMCQGSVHYQGAVAPLIDEPDELNAAGLEAPAYARIGRKLKLQGRLPNIPSSHESLLKELSAQPYPVPADGTHVRPAINLDSEEALTAHKAYNILPSASPDSSPISKRRARWQALDPRVKWLGMVLWTLIILGMNSPGPLLFTTGLIAVLVWSADISWRRTVVFFRPFLIMFLFLWVLSSISLHHADWQLGPLGIAYSGIIQGGLSILRVILMIALGFLFTETTTEAPLREALEWAIAPLKRLGIRTRNWSLAVSITLQFVPWILRKIVQLQLALRSRGRRKNQLKYWTPRQMSLLIVPLLILVISMGDELATAIESRGYDPTKERTPWFVLVWRRSDTLALMFILLTAAGLWLLS